MRSILKKQHTIPESIWQKLDWKVDIESNYTREYNGQEGGSQMKDKPRILSFFRDSYVADFRIFDNTL
jgi:hypothetical protein